MTTFVLSTLTETAVSRMRSRIVSSVAFSRAVSLNALSLSESIRLYAMP